VGLVNQTRFVLGVLVVFKLFLQHIREALHKRDHVRQLMSDTLHNIIQALIAAPIAHECQLLKVCS
jgi:uncharacterized membrane protein